MKYLILFSVVATCSMTVHAQDNLIYKRNPMKEFKLKRLLQDSLQHLQREKRSVRPVSPPAEPGVVRIAIKGDFLGENRNGDGVYAMQPDRMPCIVPNKKVQLSMPVAGIDKTREGLLTLPEASHGGADSKP